MHATIVQSGRSFIRTDSRSVVLTSDQVRTLYCRKVQHHTHINDSFTPIMLLQPVAHFLQMVPFILANGGGGSAVER